MIFDIKKNIKKGIVHLATYLIGLGAAWLSAHGFTLTPEQQALLIASLTGVFGTALTMLRNWAKLRWPEQLGWL